jgi:hypothetical protein
MDGLQRLTVTPSFVRRHGGWFRARVHHRPIGQFPLFPKLFDFLHVSHEVISTMIKEGLFTSSATRLPSSHSLPSDRVDHISLIVKLQRYFEDPKAKLNHRSIKFQLYILTPAFPPRVCAPYCMESRLSDERHACLPTRTQAM